MEPEEDKVKNEREKIEIEREKLEVEKYKARLEASKTKWTAVSVAVPVVVALLTVAYGLWSARETSLYQFQLEAAKSIMQAPTPVEANNRVLFYKKLFPEKLPDRFSPIKEEQTSDIEIVASKKELYRALVAHNDVTAQQALAIWNALFPDDEWAKEEALAKATVSNAH